MKILIVGATGATGRLLVEQLLTRGHEVVAVTRRPMHQPESEADAERLTVITTAALELPEERLTELLKDCHACASCLGHSLTLQGIYGHPRRLVTDTTRRLCELIRKSAPERKIRFVLMNSAGNRNRGRNEPVSFAQRCVLGLLRALVPPHADNEDAAEYLRTEIGPENSHIQWTVVRPDSLLNQPKVTPYETHPSPTRSAIFNSGTTSRINVAHFMADLITDDELWSRWNGQMPVIYNQSA